MEARLTIMRSQVNLNGKQAVAAVQRQRVQFNCTPTRTVRAGATLA